MKSRDGVYGLHHHYQVQGCPKLFHAKNRQISQKPFRRRDSLFGSIKGEQMNVN